MANLWQPSLQPILDDNGDTVSGGTRTFYDAGTLSLATIYTSRAGDVVMTNPVVADGSGRTEPIYLDKDLVYRVVEADAAGILLSETLDVYGFDETQAAADAQTVSTLAAQVTIDAATATADAATASAAADVASDLGNAPLYETLADLPVADGTQGWAIIPGGADEGVYQDDPDESPAAWVRKFDTQAVRAGVEADRAEAEADSVAGLLDNGVPHPSFVPGQYDNAGNVLWWLERGLLEAKGFGPELTAAILTTTGGTIDTSNPLSTDGRTLPKWRGALASQRGSAPTTQAHLWMTGDSWTERWVIPEAFHDDLEARGVPVVATGWIGVQSTGTTDTAGSLRLIGGASLTTTGASVVDASEGGTGEMGPDGLRATFPSGDTGAGFTLVCKGKTLPLYFTGNGAQFSYTVDGGAVTPETLGSGGGPVKTTIDLVTEGDHTVVITRPSAGVDLIWFGCFAGSELPGAIVSKPGNGGSTVEDMDGPVATTTAQFILTDILPSQTVGSITRHTMTRMSWLTNDSRTGVTVANFNTALDSIVASYRTASAGCEIVYAIPPANGVSGLTGGNDIADYIPGIFTRAAAQGYEVEDYYTRWPAYADSGFWFDTLHFSVGGGGAEAMAAQEITGLGGFV